MKIALCTIGSRGDIQPFLILGNYLSQYGHAVKVSSATMYSEMAGSYQVDYDPFEGEYEKLLDSETMKKVIGGNPFTISKNLKQHVYPIIEQSLSKFYELTQWADVVVYHPKTLIDVFGDAYASKLVKAYVVPMFTPTRAFPHPALNFLPLPRAVNKLSFKLTNAMLYTVRAPVKNFCRRNNLPFGSRFLSTPMIYGISRQVLARPKDFPNDHYFTGFWQSASGDDDTLPHEVLTFFETDAPKLIITFGSMPYKSKVHINDYLNSLFDLEVDMKILIVKAWGLKDYKVMDHPRVMSIDQAPFDKLFPLADVIVHHGGAGTTSAALHAGVPMFICPVLHPFGDQYFWGKQMAALGVAVPPVPLTKLKTEQLTRSVQELLNPKYRNRALEIRSRLRQENGLERARKIIETVGAQHK